MSRRLRSAWVAPRPVRHGVRDLERVVPRAVRRSGSPLPGPLVLDLVAAVLAGGASPPSALRHVGAALSRTGDPGGRRLELLSAELTHPSTARPAVRGDADSGDWVVVLRDELALAMRSGLPPTALLRRAAEEQRRRSAATQRRAVQRLEVLLVVPTGVCLLPAFVLLGVVPVVIALFRG